MITGMGNYNVQATYFGLRMIRWVAITALASLVAGCTSQGSGGDSTAKIPSSAISAPPFIFGCSFDDGNGKVVLRFNFSQIPGRPSMISVRPGEDITVYYREDLDNDGIDETYTRHRDALAETGSDRYLVLRANISGGLVVPDLEYLYENPQAGFSELKIRPENVRAVIDVQTLGLPNPTELTIVKQNGRNFIQWVSHISRRDTSFGFAALLPDDRLERLCENFSSTAHF